jgi:predicted secreted hydrolase
VLHTGQGETLGFQITFFRTRADVNLGDAPPGRFTPRHVLFAHGALTDVQAGKLWHGQRIGRWNGDPAVRPHFAALADTSVQLGGWSLERTGVPQSVQPSPSSAPLSAPLPSVAAPVALSSGSYLARLAEPTFGFELALSPTQPLLLQGEAGFSRKGPELAQASHYYSQPQLAVTGRVHVQGRTRNVTGTAWLDHEWSESLLHPEAVGWDWIGMNLDSGAALTAFRLRRADGSALWMGGSWRASAHAAPQVFGPQSCQWVALRHWLSPASQARYPVQWRVDTPAGSFEVRALLDAQELDSRRSTGTVYWEGLSELLDARSGQRVGRGYLEMTGYAGRLML